jgi:hypothetical protein
MKSVIDYRYVAPNSQEFSELQDFAASFDHKVNSHPQINVYSHYRNGVLFGYSDHVFIPVVYPAFHPKFTKPKDVIQVMSDWRSHISLSGKLGMIGVPSGDNRPNFPDNVMNKLGLERTNREIFTLNLK